MGGGILKNSTTLIAGTPGSGKTILAHQLIFSNATAEEKALIITTASEPMARMVRFMQGFKFFNADRIGTSIIYEDVGSRLLKSSAREILEYISELLLKYNPGYLVVDSFRAIHEISESTSEFRRSLYRFLSTVSCLSCTTLLIGEYGEKDVIEQPEVSIVDSIIELDNHSFGFKDMRSIRIKKMRGSNYKSGVHSLRIGPDGITIFPRFTTEEHPALYNVSEERVSIGNRVFNDLFSKGIPGGTTTLITGDPGVGKTVSAIHFLMGEAQNNNKPGAYISFQEDPNQLARVIRNFGFDLDALKKKGLVNMFYTSPVEMDCNELALKIMGTLKKNNAVRVVIDSVSDFVLATGSDRERYFNLVYSLTQWFKNNGITAVLTLETSKMFGGDLILSGLGVSHIADNVIILKYVYHNSEIKRVISVLKTRGSDHRKGVFEFIVSEDAGIKIGEKIQEDVSFM